MPWYTSRETTTTPPERVTGRWISMKQLVITLVLIVGLVVIPLKVVGAEHSAELEHVEMNLEDQASLQSGLKTFANYCMGCHSAAYSRYQRVADDLGISESLMKENIIFNPEASIGDLMVSSMPESSQNWFGVAPPDLTLVARARGTDWLNGYLKGFYLDDQRPFGVNNTVFANVAMPNVLGGLQGDQELCHGEHCAGVEHVAGTGALNEEEFDKVVYDLVNFLYYLGEPSRLDRERIGVYVLFFLAFLFVFAFMLNREYWKDVH